MRGVLSTELPVLAVILAMTTWICWPWSLDADQVFTHRDSLFTLLALDHLQNVILAGADLRAAPFAWPLPNSIAQSDWIWGQALLGLPLRIVGVSPWRTHNLLVLFGLITSAWACHRIAASLLGAGPHTWVAAIVGGLSPMHLTHTQHVNLVHHEVMLVGALLLVHGLAHKRALAAGGGGLLFGLSAHFGAYMGANTLLVAGILVAVAAWARRGDLRCWTAAAAGLALGCLTVVPVALLYLEAAAHLGLGGNSELQLAEVWDPTTSFSLNYTAPLHELFRGPMAPRMQQLVPANPGYLATVLALLSIPLLLATARRRWLWIGWGLVLLSSLLLALGPRIVWNGSLTGIPAPYALLEQLPGMDLLRGPGRWLSVTYCALGLFSAAGLKFLLARIPGRLARAVLMAVILGIVGLEIPRAITDIQPDLKPYEAYVLIDHHDQPGALYERFPSPPAGCSCNERTQLWGALFHGRPVAAGSYARESDLLERINGKALTWPDSEAESMFRASGVRLVLEHPPIEGTPGPNTSCQMVGRHRLCALDGNMQPHLLSPHAITAEANGEVIGFRWPEGTDEERVFIRCGNAWRIVSAVAPWADLSALRHGAHSKMVDVLLTDSCPMELLEGPPGAVPLYANPQYDGAPWPGEYPPRTRSIDDFEAIERSYGPENPPMNDW